MGIPVVESIGAWASGAVTDTINVAEPAELTVGDGCVIVLACDKATAGDPWDNVTYKPTGFTLIGVCGAAGNVDVFAAAFYREITGVESWPIPCLGNYSGRHVGAATRLSGIKASAMLDAVGTRQSVDSATDFALSNEVTTTVPNCLAMYVSAHDGADGAPMSTSGAGWTEIGEGTVGADAVGASACIGKKDMASAGGAGTVTISNSSIDGCCGLQFSIAGADDGAFDQDQFRFGKDDGSEAAHTWHEAQNVNVTLPVATPSILRIQASTSGDQPTQQMKLQCKKTSDPDSAYADVPVA